jgi:hypothetical protein
VPTIDATAGGADANSFATLAEAQTYFGERVGASAWEDAAEPKQKKALITATRRLNALKYVGYKTSDTQALVWPRIGAFDESGYEYDTAIVPAPVKEATFEAALKILTDGADGADPLADSELAQFDRAKVGPLEVDINHGHKPAKTPEAALRVLRHLLRGHRLMAQLERS